MKRKKLYISLAALLTSACVIYTFASFTNPTDKEQEQSVFTNALQLVDHSFRNIDDREDSVLIEEAGFKLLPKKETTKSENTSSDPEEITENTEEEIVTISSLAEEENRKVSEEKKDSKESASTDSDKKEEAKSKETSKDSKKETKASKEETKSKEDETVTILSISENSCNDKDIAISIAESYVNIRKKANTESKIVGKLYKNNAAHILKTKGDWLYIESGNVKGYVKAEYVKSGLTEDELAEYGTVTATVNTDGLNVRAKASTDAKRVDVIYMGESYPVLKQKKNWVKLNIEDDQVKGYVKSEYVSIAMTFSEAISIEEENALKKAEEAKRAEQASVASSSNSNTTTVQVSSTSHSNDELALLACLVHAEAGNQSYEGKLAVANVVLNRVRSSKYPNSIKNVIYQRGQFSVASSGSLSKQLNQYSNFNSSSQKLSIQAAKDALAGINNIGSRLYFNRYSSHVASKHSSNGVKIDDQFFW